MSWLNNSLNTIKGQLTTLAQEILEETAGPGDTEYRPTTPSIDSRTTIEPLEDTQRAKLCSEKDIEIQALRKQIENLQSQICDSGAGNNLVSGSANSGRTSKTNQSFSSMAQLIPGGIVSPAVNKRQMSKSGLWLGFWFLKIYVMLCVCIVFDVHR